MNRIERRDMAMHRRDMARRDRAMRDYARMDRTMRGYGRDGRNPYGAAGGYVSDRARRDYARMDYARDYAGSDYAQGDVTYTVSGEKNPELYRKSYARGGYIDEENLPEWARAMRDEAHRDYARNSMGQYTRDGHHYMPQDYASYDYYSYDYAEGNKLSNKELKEWYEELVEDIPEQYQDLYSKENLEKLAKQMKIEFDKFTPMEFMTTVAMVATDYPKSVGYADVNRNVAIAKEWLCDKNTAARYGEKLAAYYDAVVEGV